MTKLVNRAKMTTATTGTGSISLASAVDGYQTFANAGVANSDVVRYVIEDGDAWEIGLGTYSAGTLTRGSIESSNADAALNLTGNAVVYVSAAAADLQELVDFADNFVLPAADGSTGQVLTTNGAGTLTFSTISGYTDADVNTHLNTGTAASGEVLSWTGTDYDWIAVAAGATGINGLSDGYSDGSSVGLGSGALANDDGSSNTNTALGINAGNATTNTDGSVFVGNAAGEFANASFTTAVGRSALGGNFMASLLGQHNTAVGYGAGQLVTAGARNVLVGSQAGLFLSTGSDNVALGYTALQGLFMGTIGSYNVAVGSQAGFDLTLGANNFLGGYRAGYGLTTGSNNVALGNGAMDAATTGGRNIAIGQDAMGSGVATAASGDNVAIGYQAAFSLTSASGNVSMGAQSLRFNTTGGSNTALGNSALYSNVGGSTNTAVGSSALFTNTTGSNNTALGRSALYGGGAGLTGSGNTGIGHSAGQNLTSGINNFFGGYQAGDATTTGSNQIIVGFGADASSATVSNEITLGNSSITRFRVPGAGIDNTSAALSGTTPSVDTGARDTYTLSTTGNTTFTFTGAPSSGQVGTFSLIVTAGGTHTLTWPASVDWAGGTAPDAPASGEKDIYTFMTVDGGTTWYGFLAGDAMA